MELSLKTKPVHVFRQSWLNTYFTCPEQARLIRADTYPPDQTDAAAAGTATHAAIEAVLVRCREPEDAVALGLDTFRNLASSPDFRWVKVKREKTAFDHIEGGFYSWYDNVYPTLKATIWVEEGFKFLFHEDDKREVWLSGTADYADSSGIMDWKLSANKDKFGKEGWKLRRWSVQATIYAAAAYEAGLYPRDAEVPFTFVNLDFMGRRPQRLPADRTMQHVSFLKEQLVSIAQFIEADLPNWPLRDQHALCSSDWCMKWYQCKGKHFQT